MVAVHFGMPRELAKTMEDQARRELALIQAKQLGALKCVDDDNHFNVNF